MKSYYHICLFAVLIGLAGISQADTLPLVVDGSIQLNDGTAYSVQTDWYYGGIHKFDSLNEGRIAMAFDLTGLEQPDSATLTLHHLGGDAVGRLYAYPGNGMISASDYPGTWVEDVGGIQMTMSAFIGNIGGPSGYHYGYGITFDVDVTEALAMAYDKGWPYLGLLLTSNTGLGRDLALDGTNPQYYTAGTPPALQYIPVPEPATLALLAIGGAGLLRRRRF